MGNIIDFPAWRSELGKGDKNQILGTTANAMLFLAHSPELKGLTAWDELANRPVITRPPPILSISSPTLPGPYPRQWEGPDVHAVLAFLERTETSSFKLGQIEGAMHAVAALNRFHPVRTYLDGLEWDGWPRIDHWLQHAFGAPADDYVRAVGRAYLIGAVRRVRQPGCKLDTAPVLGGAQGIGKSRTIRALHGADWTTDYLPADIAGKDAAMALCGVWCVELAEVDHVIRAEPETVKAFLSRQVDRFRPPYGKNIIESPRQAVLIGTSNRSDYLRDDTGNRRFWPVTCTTANTAWVAEHRDQLWAEAAHYEAAGEPHWLPDAVLAEAEARAAANVIEDTWDEHLRRWLDGTPPAEITTAVALSDAFSVPKERQDRRLQLRAAACLKRAGLKQVVRGGGKMGNSRRVWMREDQE